MQELNGRGTTFSCFVDESVLACGLLQRHLTHGPRQSPAPGAAAKGAGRGKHVNRERTRRKVTVEVDTSAGKPGETLAPTRSSLE